MSLELFGDFGFAGAFDQTANPYQDQQVCINWFPEIAADEKGAKTPIGLLGCPGLVQVAAVPGGGSPGFSSSMTQWPVNSLVQNLPARGCWVLPGWMQALVVIGNVCYLVQVVQQGNLSSPGSLSLTQVGLLQTHAGPVSIRDNNAGGYAVIVDGPNGYLYNLSTHAFAQITDPAFLGADTVAFIDGWWIFNRPGTQTFYTNAAQYSIAFSGSNFALKDSSTDELIAVVELKEELWLIGERTTEIWYDAGGQFFAFQRLVGAPMQIGCMASATVQKIVAGGEGLIWLGRSERGENIIVKTKGFTFSVISTPAVSNAIAQYTTTSDAIGYVYQEGAHEFYVLTFPSEDQTWVYDATMPPQYAWHQRLSYDPYLQQFHRHRSNCFMNFGGMRVVGDYQNGALYQLTRAAHTDAGWPILARRRAPYIWNKENRERVFMASLQVDFAPGQGNSTGIGSNPQAELSISRDYGSTFGPMTPAPMGKLANFLNRCIWRRLGFSRGAIVQLDVIDPVNRDIVGATLRAMGP